MFIFLGVKSKKTDASSKAWIVLFVDFKAKLVSHPSAVFIRYDMTRSISPSDFRLPDAAHPRICSFFELWLEAGGGGLPDCADFDIASLSGQYPLLARIAVDGPERTLVWREVGAGVPWPFGMPVKGHPVIESVPQPDVKRLMGAFHQMLASDLPDYRETTSWMYGRRPLSLARLGVPVMAGAGRELIALWEIIEPPLGQ